MAGGPPLERSKPGRVFGAGILLALFVGCSLTDLDEFQSGGQVTDDAGTSQGDGQADRNTGGETPEEEEEEGGPSCGENRYCAVAPPSGWSFVAIKAGEASPCPSGYSDGVDLVEIASPPSGSGSTLLCGCTCGEPVGTPSCTTGTARLEKFPTFVCIAGAVTSFSSACTTVNLNLASSFVRVGPLAPTQVACTSTVQNEKPPPVETNSVRSCALVEARTEGCSADRRCIDAPSDGYRLCVARPQRNALCPRGYSRRRALGAAVEDTRKCESCRCETTDTCTNARVRLHGSSDCEDTPKEILADGSCKNPDTSSSYVAARYVADRVPGTCKAVDEVISGSVSLTEEITVCCPSGAGD